MSMVEQILKAAALRVSNAQADPNDCLTDFKSTGEAQVTHKGECAVFSPNSTVQVAKDACVTIGTDGNRGSEESIDQMR